MAHKNGNKSVILNLILPKLHRIYWRIVVNACVMYRKPILIGAGDIYPDGQNSNKSAILNLILMKPHRIYGRIIVNACEKYRELIFVGV